jgi:hypothetical protein
MVNGISIAEKHVLDQNVMLLGTEIATNRMHFLVTSLNFTYIFLSLLMYF